MGIQIIDTVHFTNVVADTVDFPEGNLMSTSQVTTGIAPLVIGAGTTFTLVPFKDLIAWALTGGSGNLLLKDPNGMPYTLPATIALFSATVNWTVIAPAGTWTRAWSITDGTGLTLISKPISFTVTASP